MTLNDKLQFALLTSVRGGQIARSIRQKGFKVVEKSGGLGPVTTADRAVNVLFLREISEMFPDDFIVAEESGKSHERVGISFWCIDPIDGTKDFINGTNEWSVMCAYVMNGIPVLGVVYQPETGRIQWALKGEGAFQATLDVELNWELKSAEDISTQGKKISLGSEYEENDLVMVNSKSHPDVRVGAVAKAMGVSKTYQHGSVGLKIAEIVEGKAHFYVNLSGKCFIWDTAAGEAILIEAGGILVNQEGESIIYDGDELRVDEPFYAGVPAQKENALRAIQEIMA